MTSPRGGYVSSGRPATDLRRPPTGPAVWKQLSGRVAANSDADLGFHRSEGREI